MEDFEQQKKKVDDAWKEAAKKEEPGSGAGAVQEGYPQEIDFSLFLSSLMIEGLMALGEVENPATNKKEANLPQAKYVIDVIGMLETKTKNNLSEEEKRAIDYILYELRMKYVEKAGGQG